MEVVPEVDCRGVVSIVDNERLEMRGEIIGGRPRQKRPMGPPPLDEGWPL